MLYQCADLAQVAQRKARSEIHKISTLVRYRPEDIDAWIAEQQSAPSVAQEARQ